MLKNRGFSLLLPLSLSLAFCLGSLTAVGGEQSESIPETQLSINGYEGRLQKIEVPATVQAIRELKIGDPPYLKELDSVDSYGINSCQGGALQRGSTRVHVFRLQFQSEDQALSILNLKLKPSKKRSPLSVEDPTNCRTPYFGLYFDGTDWSGYRRVKDVVVLLKGAVSQEDFFRIMEKVI
jgi:hypothetical protein